MTARVAILAVVLVVLLGTFGLAFAGLLPADAAVSFAEHTLAAFIGVLAGNEIQLLRASSPKP